MQCRSCFYCNTNTNKCKLTSLGVDPEGPACQTHTFTEPAQCQICGSILPLASQQIIFYHEPIKNYLLLCEKCYTQHIGHCSSCAHAEGMDLHGHRIRFGRFCRQLGKAQRRNRHKSKRLNDLSDFHFQGFYVAFLLMS